jgi:hypothetical protein
MRPEELAIMRNDELAIERYARQPLPTLRDIIAVLFRQRWHLRLSLSQWLYLACGFQNTKPR